MATIYYDNDCNLALVKDKTIAIIGYGNQGRAQALNMRDSGCTSIIVGSRKGSSYDQAVEDGFAVKPIEEAHGVYSYPVEREVIESGTMEKDGKNGKTVQLYLRVKTTYRFICMDDPSSYLDIVSYGDGVDTQDKAPGKAMTYSDKYALMKAYKIQTGDDPDKYAIEPTAAVNTQYSMRKNMERYIAEHYDSENMFKILDYYHVTTLAQLNMDQLTKVYAQKVAQERQAGRA